MVYATEYTPVLPDGNLKSLPGLLQYYPKAVRELTRVKLYGFQEKEFMSNCITPRCMVAL